MRHIFLAALLALALAGCDSSEERAEKHFQSAVSLIAAGDIDRGLVELRNVFKLNQAHLEARRLFARTLDRRGDATAAYRQYAQLAERVPTDAEALQALARLAFAAGNLPEARTRVDAALAALPEDPALRAYDAALDYFQARQADDPAAAEAVERARQLLAADPALMAARQVAIADLLDQQKLDAALDLIDAGIALEPGSRQLHATRLAVLYQLGEKDEIEGELKRMLGLYPQDEALGATLVRWYMSEGRLDEAEEWLRRRIGEGTESEPRVTLLRFLAEQRGPEAALAELETLLAEPQSAAVAANRPLFRALRAGLRFSAGEREAAMAELEELIAEGAPAAAAADATAEAREQLNRVRVTLAQMRSATGNEVGARALVEEVLASNPADVEALKLKGGWLIDDDETDAALAALREALNVAPRDPALLTLLARTYERQGNRQLTGQMLQQAVEASNRAPAESQRYAAFLIADRQYRSAEDVVIEALRLAPANVQLLGMLGQIHLADKDWMRTERDIARLQEIGSPEARALADELQARLLAAQGEVDKLTTFLADLAETAAAQGAPGDATAVIGPEAAVIRSLVANGRVEEAETRARALAERMPEAPQAKFVLASVLLLTDDQDEAARLLREATAEDPQLEGAWTALYGISQRQGDLDAAAAVLDAATAALPQSTALRWARAGLMERRGDTEGAIAIYEALYAENSNAAVIANNLASLLASAREDAASLERAWTVARRLKDTKVPAFADTYGWIAFRRGEAQTALPYLELAAEGLPLDPTVQYHLGQAYAALNRPEEARAAYARARQQISPAMPGVPGLAELLDKAEAALEGG